MELSDTLNNIPEIDDSERDWKKYNAEVRKHLTEQQKTMHMRQRVRWRMNMKKFKAHREEQRKKQHEVRLYYNYALRRPAQEAKPTTLHVVTDTGEINIIDNKQQIYKKEIEMSQQHMGKGRERWYKHKGKLFPVYANTAEGREIRKKYKKVHYQNQSGRKYRKEYEKH